MAAVGPGRLIASSALQEKRERELLTLNVREERYRVLVRERPELVELVPQKDLARYIGVTPVAMSCIVSRVRHGNATESVSAASPVALDE